MTQELQPGSSPQAGPRKTRKKKHMSTKQITANQTNGARSRGPVSPGGKRKSRLNSLKHGHCALVVPIPGEDPELFEKRLLAWRKELNPQGEVHADYLLALAVRKSFDLDRLHVAKTARAAARARDAARDRTEARAREVEELLGGLVQENCGINVRRLRQTREGCQALIDEWDCLKAPLIAPAQWDKFDTHRAACLMGRPRLANGQSPSVIEIPTKWIMDHRKVAEKLKANEWPDAIDWKLQYDRIDQHKRDLAIVGELEQAAKLGVDWVMMIIEAEQAHLREQMAMLEEHEAVDESEACLRARLDETEEGRLLQRYEMESERGLFKVLDLLRGGASAWRMAMQDQETKEVKAKKAEEEVASAVAAEDRNEPISEGVPEPREGVEVVEIDGIPVVQMTIGRPTDPPDRE